MTSQIFSNTTELDNAFDGRIVGMTGLRNNSIDYAISWLPAGCTYEIITKINPITGDHVLYVIALAPIAIVPCGVVSTVKSAIDSIVSFNTEIKRLRDFDSSMGSCGRYEADGFLNLRNQLISAKRTIETFKNSCKSKKIDADKHLKEYGFTLHLEPSKEASEWLDSK